MINLLKAVYCYYFPEVRDIVSSVTKEYPHDIYLQSITPGLDEYHEAFYQAYCNHFGSYLQGATSFPFHYYTNGSSEGIFHVLSQIASRGQDKKIYLLHGEYEGYEGYGSNLGLKFTKVSYDELLTAEPGILFISNPTSKDGSIISNEDIARIGDSGHQIYYDISYFGITKSCVMDLSHPNIMGVFISMSKPFGMYYYRAGLYLSRTEMLTLKPNKRFKNILNIIIATKVLETLKPFELYEKYAPLQKGIVDDINKEYGSDLVPSAVLMLATCNEVPIQHPEWSQFSRGPNLRVCITDYLVHKESL